MKRVLVRFLLKGSSHNLDVLMTETEAKDLINKWKGSASPSEQRLAGYDAEQDRYWSIAHSEISSIFTINPERVAEEARRVAAQRDQQRYYPRSVDAAPLSVPYQG